MSIYIGRRVNGDIPHLNGQQGRIEAHGCDWTVVRLDDDTTGFVPWGPEKVLEAPTGIFRPRPLVHTVED